MLLRIESLTTQYMQPEEIEYETVYINPDAIVSVRPFPYHHHGEKHVSIILIPKEGRGEVERHIVAGNADWWAKRIDRNMKSDFYQKRSCTQCEAKGTVRFFYHLPGSPYLEQECLEKDEMGFLHYKCLTCG